MSTTAYWQETLDELARLDAAPEVEHMPMRSTAEYDYFGLRYTSTGPYRIFAWLSRPKGSGPFPAILFAPRYGSVNNPPPSWARGQYVTITVMVRGQRMSDSPWSAMFPGYMTVDCHDPQRFVYRGAVCDLVRGLDLLLDMPAVDRRRVAVHSPDGIAANLALILAALRPAVRCLTLDTPAWNNLAASLPAVTAYPVAELHHYLRAYPDRAEAALATFAHFDALAHAPRVRSAVLLRKNAANAPLAAALGAAQAVELHETANEYLHSVRQTEWIRAWTSTSASA